MKSPLEEKLKELLKPSAANKTLETWRGHFSALADTELQKRYFDCLKQCQGKLSHADYRLWVPISQINARARRGTGALSLFLKCHGRKVGELKFPAGVMPTFKPENSFEHLLKSSPECIPPTKNGPLQAFKCCLNILPGNEGFQKGVLPEWKFEAWLLDFLSGTGKKEFSLTQPVRYPQKIHGKISHNGMFLQISSPISASSQNPKLSSRANAHTDILVRIGRGGQRLGILEVKALKKGAKTLTNDPNIAKALKQAFCYAFCYHQVFVANLLEPDGRHGILDVLGYGKPGARKTPSITAVAVVPKGYFNHVLDEANSENVNLAAADTVMSERIRLEIWEYCTNGAGSFQLTSRTYLVANGGKLVKGDKPSATRHSTPSASSR